MLLTPAVVDHVGPSLARLTTLAFLEARGAAGLDRRGGGGLDLEPLRCARESGSSVFRRASAAWDRRLKLWQALAIVGVRGDLDEPDSALARRVADISALALEVRRRGLHGWRYACEGGVGRGVPLLACCERCVVGPRRGSVARRRRAARQGLGGRAGRRPRNRPRVVDGRGRRGAHRRRRRLDRGRGARAAAGLGPRPRGLAAGLVRGVAVLLSKRLFREFPPSETDVAGRALAHALERDPDVARLVKRQGRFFHDLRAMSAASVR